jgi:hypothetical protein
VLHSAAEEVLHFAEEVLHSVEVTGFDSAARQLDLQDFVYCVERLVSLLGC